MNVTGHESGVKHHPNCRGVGFAVGECPCHVMERRAYLYNVYELVDEATDGLWMGRLIGKDLPLDQAISLRNLDVSNRRVWYNGAGAPSESHITDSPTAQGGGPGLDPDAAVGRVV